MKVRIKIIPTEHAMYPDRHKVQVWRWWFPVWTTIYDVGGIDHARKLAYAVRNPQIEVVK